MLPIPDKSWVTGEFLQDWHEIERKAYIILTTGDFELSSRWWRTVSKRYLVLYSLILYEPYEVHINDVRRLAVCTLYQRRAAEPVLPEKQLLRTVATEAGSVPAEEEPRSRYSGCDRIVAWSTEHGAQGN
jgi:hypothetical protein